MTEDDETPSAKHCERFRTPMAFALMLESAFEDFEFLRALIEKEISVEVRQNPPVQTNRSAKLLRTGSRILMALAKSFLFFSARAHRIREHGAGSLQLNLHSSRPILRHGLRINPLPAGFAIPAQPVKASKPPVGPDWVHEIKHDGY
jgi:hypothetical protein